MATDIDVSQPWRKAGFHCAPYTNGPEDGERFVRDYEQGADGVDVDKTEVMSSVLNRTHEGGLNGPVIPAGNAGANVTKRLMCAKRQKKTAADIKLHIETGAPAIWDALHKAHPGDGEAQWALFKTLVIKPPTESSAEDKKADIRNRTLLGSVGFRVGSLTNFSVQPQVFSKASLTTGPGPHSASKLS